METMTKHIVIFFVSKYSIIHIKEKEDAVFKVVPPEQSDHKNKHLPLYVCYVTTISFMQN